MVSVRRAGDRGHADHGWLDTYHTFSFGGFHDPGHMGFGSLRVINEDRIRPGRGFAMHPHRDMEIVTYVMSGALEHCDSMGNGSVLRAGGLQRMSAGTGISHSEFNPSRNEPAHLYQIWIEPRRLGIKPGYEQRRVDDCVHREGLHPVASSVADDGAMDIHQDAALYLARLSEHGQLEHALSAGRRAWVQVTQGSFSINGQEVVGGDGVAITDEPSVLFQGSGEGEAILFDLA